MNYELIKTIHLQLCIVIILLFFRPFVIGQSMHGEIIYAQNNSWSKIMASLPYLNQEEKDRIIRTWGKGMLDIERMRLQFNDSVSYYTYVLADKSEEYTYSYKKADYQIYRNYTQQTRFDRIGLFGKTYIIKEETPKIKWKILSEIKEVNGYVCMKAETMDTIKNQKITAWFTDKILVPIGPEEFGGLPGLILEIDINEGASSIIAETINLDAPQKIAIPKSKGKPISYSEYRKLIKTYIHDCIERRRNPYWDIRY